MIAVLIIILAAWFRYDVFTERGAVISRYDRWTGSVEWWNGQGWER